jgi:hypothetical protein
MYSFRSRSGFSTKMGMPEIPYNPIHITVSTHLGLFGQNRRPNQRDRRSNPRFTDSPMLTSVLNI